MKKFLSILLAAMLILGMLPATALPTFAADGTWTLVKNIADLSVGDTVIIAAKNASYALSTKQNTNNRGQVSVSKSNDTLTFTTEVQELTLEKGTASGTYALSTGNGYLYAAGGTSTKNNYLKTSATKNDNCDWNITIASTGIATVKAAKTSIVKNWLRHNSSSSLFSCYSTGQNDICIYKLVKDSCEHTNFEMQDKTDATCTTDGFTGNKYCLDCEKVVEEGTAIPAGHKYENGSCSVCGADEPAGYAKVTNVYGLSATDKVVVTMTNSSGTYALTNGNGTSAAPKATKVTVKDDVIAAGEVTDALVWNIVVSGTNLTIYPKDTTNTWLYCTSTNNGVRVGTNTAKVFTIDSNSGYLKHTGTSRYVGVYNSQDWRCYTTNTGDSNIANQTLVFYKLSDGQTAETVCDHKGYTTYVGNDGKAATCTEAGQTATVYCSNCNGVVKSPETIVANGHNYVGGECTVCHVPDPFINLPGTYYIAAKRTTGSYWYMTSNLGTATTKRYQAVNSGLTELPAKIAEPDINNIFEIVKNEDGTYSILAVGVTGNNYLGGIDDNAGLLVGANGKNNKFTAEWNQDGTFSFYFTATEKRYLSLNGTAGSDYFAWYKGTQKQNLSLIPADKPVVEMGGKQYTSFEEAYAEDPDTPIKLLAALENIDVSGDLYLDLNGFNADVDNANAVYLTDSTATNAAAGKGKLTTTSEVIVDNTVNGVRYIALENSGVYTAHVLELKLTAVSLRTTQVGIYYKAQIICDPVLAAATETYGVVLSVHDMPGADFETEKVSDEFANGWSIIKNADKTQLTGNKDADPFTSGSVFGIFKNDEARQKTATENNISLAECNALYAQKKIYASAYLKLNDDKTILMSANNVSFSLEDVLKKVNDELDFTQLSEKQLESLAGFCQTWAAELVELKLKDIAEKVKNAMELAQ